MLTTACLSHEHHMHIAIKCSLLLNITLVKEMTIHVTSDVQKPILSIVSGLCSVHNSKQIKTHSNTDIFCGTGTIYRPLSCQGVVCMYIVHLHYAVVPSFVTSCPQVT